MKNLTKNSQKLNAKAKKELNRIIEEISSKNSYEAQKEYLSNKKFINSFHL